MKTMKTRKVRMLTIMTIAALILTMFAPLGAWAAPEDYRIQVEYSATQAGSINVPETLSFGGYDYKLLEKTSPTLAGTLPVSRSYSYKISGVVDEQGLAEIKAMLPQANLSMTKVFYQKIVPDLPKTESGLLMNDAALLPDAFIDGDINYALKSIAWEKGDITDRVVEAPRDYSWTAKAIYEGYIDATAYTIADVTYTNEGIDAGAYIVIATYEPVTPVVEPTTPDGNPVVAPDVTQPAADVTPTPAPDDVVVPDDTPPLAPGPAANDDNSQDTIINDTPTPLDQGTQNAQPASWIADNYGWLIGAVVLLVLIILAICIASGRKKAKQE